MRFVPSEERDGFYVQPMVKRMWAVLIDMLKEIDTICKRHDINYYIISIKSKWSFYETILMILEWICQNVLMLHLSKGASI